MSADAPPEHVVAFDFLRSVAAASVVVVHVLGPYRAKIGAIADAEFAIAVAINGALRWSVPVFIMISGALLLADARAFRLGYYVQRRVAKALIPFVVWSVGYAVLAGVDRSGFNGDLALATLHDAPFHETYYHLGFFYYFIPLYLIVPLLRSFVASQQRAVVGVVLTAWLVASAAYLGGAEGFWSVDLFMFGGYLLLGYVLWQYGTLPLWLLLTGALVAVCVSDYMVISDSLRAGIYDVDRWFSYKSLNTAIAAVFVFSLGLRYAQTLSVAATTLVAVISRHSLGIYLIHPLFLWPVREFDLYFAHPLLVIPLWTVVCGGLALTCSMMLARWSGTRWLVP